MKYKDCVQGKVLVGGELAEPEGKLTKAQKKNLKRLEKKVAARATTDASVASSEVCTPSIHNEQMDSKLESAGFSIAK